MIVKNNYQSRKTGKVSITYYGKKKFSAQSFWKNLYNHRRKDCLCIDIEH